MKINLALILSIILAVGLVSLGFTIIQTTTEREKLNSELQLKTIRNADEFYSNHLKQIEKGDSLSLAKISGKTVTRYGFLGVAIYYNADSIKVLDTAAQSLLPQSTDYIAQAMAADSSMGNIIQANRKDVYEFIKVIQVEDQPDKAMVFYS